MPTPHELLDHARRLFLGGRLDESRAAFDAVLAANARDADAWQGRGLVAQAQGRLADAIAALARAVELAPDAIEFRAQLASAQQDGGRLEDARACWLDTTRRWPVFALAWEGLGVVEQALGDADAAHAAYERACALEPTAARALKLATAISPIAGSERIIEIERARMDAAYDALLHSPLRLEDPVREALWPHFYLAFHGESDRALNTKAAAVYRRLCPALEHVAPHCARPRAPRDSRFRGNDVIRVGFLSKFLHNHSIGRTSRGFFDALPRERFETVAIFVAPLVDDEYSRAIRASAARHVVIPQDLASARAAVGALELDVLFYQDIGMEPFSYFLSFSRLAPVQCVSFGHPDTTGVPTMDWFVSNDLFEPTGAQAHYSEKLFLLRGLGTLAYYAKPRRQARPKARADFGFGAKERVYLCPQNLFKFHPAIDALFGAILERDDAGVLALVEGREPGWTARLRARFERAFPRDAHRVRWIPRQASADYLDLIACADVMLDTIHFNGMNTSLEAFAVGTPVVTWPRELQRGRHTAGMYRRMGIEDAIASSGEAYVELALALGTDRARRDALSARILAAHDVLFEDPRVIEEFARFFESAVAAS